MNEDKFTGKANIYAKYRPSYPEELINYLYTEASFTKDSVIADIGSGTGLFAELLLKQGSFVYGVEPNEDMRSVAVKTLADYKKYKPVGASAENTGLPDNSMDFVTAAQAFHWFDREEFKRECNRILKNQGKAVLVWNSRDSKSELVIENDEINRIYCINFKGFTGGMRGVEPEEYHDFFKNGICEYKIFRYDLIFDEESFIGRNMSASYAPKTSDDNYEAYILALKKLFEKYGSSGSLCMPNLTRCYAGEV